jgi:hypothetical protein
MYWDAADLVLITWISSLPAEKNLNMLNNFGAIRNEVFQNFFHSHQNLSVRVS